MTETIKKLKKEIERLRTMIDYDFLTGLYNRQGFTKEAEKFLEEFKNRDKIKEKRKISFKNFSLIFIDIDNLKLINDGHGHRAGDRALKNAANVFKNSIRDFDIAARWGGDEFVIGLVGVNSKEALKIAEKIRRKLKSIKINSQNLSASFGIAAVLSEKPKKNILNLYELIEKADMTMYDAKKNKGKDFVAVYN